MSLSDERLDEIVKEQLFFEKSGNTAMWPSAYYDMARELQSLRAALEPFAEEAQFYEDDADDFEITIDLNVGMLRKAARALAEHGARHER